LARSNHCIPKFMQPGTGCLTPPKFYSMLQILCACSGLLRHHPPHNVKPKAKRFQRPLKNSSRSNRSLIPIFSADQKRTFGLPESIVMAMREDKSLGPTQTQDIRL
jgi:hypothetical protein